MFSSLDAAELLIEALAPAKDNPQAFHRLLFKAGAISYLLEAHPQVSVIVLKGGAAIPVALPYPKLKEMLYQPDFRAESPLDLTAVTGPAVRDVLVPRLAETFTVAADSKRKTPEEPFQIALNIENNSGGGRRHVIFPSDYISYYEPAGHDKHKTFLQLKSGYTVEGQNYFFFNIPIDQFMRAYTRAKMELVDKLDLSQECLSGDSLLPPAAACKRYTP